MILGEKLNFFRNNDLIKRIIIKLNRNWIVYNKKLNIFCGEYNLCINIRNKLIF